MNYISLNGHIHFEKDLLFGIQNRSFRYGDGLFESMRMIDGKICFFPLHMERLFKGMHALKLQVHSSFNEELVASEIYALARKNKIYKDARIRFSVFRNDGGLYAPDKNSFSYLIEMHALDTDGYTWSKKGLIIDVYKDVRKDFSALSHLKTANSLAYVLAGVHKNEKDVDECLILNSHGNLVEAISSNLFLISKEHIYTPALTEGCIDGVMRKVVIGLARRNKIAVSETSIDPALIESADEIFLTNAASGIRWIVGYKNKRYFSRLSKYLFDQLSV